MLLASSASRVARAQDGEPIPLQAQRLEHTLGYLAADYARFGRSEHEEHLAMATAAERIARGLPAPPDVAARVASVRERIDASAPTADVLARVDDLRRALIGAYRIEDAPEATPSVAHGRALYEQNCASCHGLTGRADTARAASVRPHPVNFRDPLFGETLTPYEITTTIRFGIAGTAMVPFAALGDADRWDIAFYVLGLRHPGPLAANPPPYSLSELANRTDEELRSELSALPLARDDIEPAVAALRRGVAYDRRPRRDALALARGQIDAARVAVARGDRKAALDDVQEAATHGLRPAEAALGSVDPTVGPALGGTLAYLTDRLRAGAPPAEVDAAIGMTQRALTRADRAIDASYARRGLSSTLVQGGSHLVRAGLLAALGIGALLCALWLESSREKRRRLHRGWLLASVSGLLGGSLGSAIVAVPVAAVQAALVASCLLAGVALLVARLRSRPRWPRALLAGVSFAGAFGGAFDAAAFFASLLACGVPRVAAGDVAQPDAWPADLAQGSVVASAGDVAASADPHTPCSDPGFGPGPELHAAKGLLPFEVTHDCIFPAHERLEIGLDLKDDARPRRAQLEALLRNLFDQVKTALGKETPESVHICAYAAGTVVWKDPYGCLEYDADEGPAGELDLHLDLPFDPAEWAQRFAARHANGSAASRKVQVTVDETKRELKVVYPFVEQGTDRWAEHLTYGDAAIAFFPLLFDFYPPQTDLQAFTFVGTWKGKPVLTVRIPDLDTFLSIDPWPLRERMTTAGIPLGANDARTPEQTATLAKEYTTALGKLPQGSVVADGLLPVREDAE